ncbi:MAG: hypothetical protein KQH63_18540 [Desulfobulbaceae bacterium]|nr:hypothetical protein [Desulfobulbaceae bacterium]
MMIDKSAVIPFVVQKIKSLPLESSLHLLTYKRDRSIHITRMGDDVLQVQENGFETATFTLKTDKIRKLLKTLLKKEFPRSNKVRITLH